jgi:hypothetical protein
MQLRVYASLEIGSLADKVLSLGFVTSHLVNGVHSLAARHMNLSIEL